MTHDDRIIVRCEQLTTVYGEITALRELDIEVPRGHIFGYIGHNGAGKTTTIRILAGLLTPTRGRAAVGGVDVASGRDKIRSLVGYMPDSFGVYDRMRVWEYLDFFGAAFKIPRKQRRARIDFVLEVADADDMRDRFVDTLSRGMKQRVGIARTLLHDPLVLLLDEPASGLDPQARVHMRHLLRRLADGGKTLMVSSHILPELAAVCDSIGILDHGRLLACGTLDDVLARIRRDRLMELKAVAPAAGAADLLARHELCKGIDDSDRASGVMRFSFTGGDEDLAALLASLHAQGTKVVTFREVPLSLEDAYLAISGDLPGAEAHGQPAGGESPPDAPGGQA